MNLLFLLGRVLFGGYFLMNAFNHFTKTGMLTGYATSKGVPSPRLAVLLSGLFIGLGGAGIFLGAYVKYALILLGVFLVIVSFKMHNFWSVTDPNQRMMEMVNFTKNMALLGAVLMFTLLTGSSWNTALNWGI